MESNHIQPKIANSSRRLPGDFMSSRTMGMLNPKKSHGNKQQSNNQPEKNVEAVKKPKQNQSSKKKANKNPLGPVRQCMRMFNVMENDLKNFGKHSNTFFNKYHQQLNVDKDQDKQLKSQNKSVSQNSIPQKMEMKKQKNNSDKIKYENCITLAVLKKHAKGCLKKILHVPTLTMHYLRQSDIGSDVDKNQMDEWIQQVNNNSGIHGLRIIQLFWNVPEGYYSILYEYFEGSTLPDVLDEFYSLPLTTLKLLVKSHINSIPAIYNSQLLLGSDPTNKNNVIIKYLPFFQQEHIIGGSVSKRLQVYMEQKQVQHSQKVDPQNFLSARLGIMLLVGYFGEVVVDQDFNQLQIKENSNKDEPCCLLHDIFSVERSLSKIQVNNRTSDKSLPNLIDFLCLLLRYNSETQISTQKIIMNPFLKEASSSQTIQKQFPTFEEIQFALDYNPEVNNSDKTININNNKQLTQILDAIELILQNIDSDDVQVSLNDQDERICCLARQLGLDHALTELVEELKVAYKGSVA